MIAKHKLARINELAKKAKTSGLSAEETLEQAKLRREYISSVPQSDDRYAPYGDDHRPERQRRDAEKIKGKPAAALPLNGRKRGGPENNVVQADRFSI